MIKSEDISVVIQGNYSDATEKSIKSVRKYLPDSEIILSTWEKCKLNQDIIELCDIILMNKNPEACLFSLSHYKYNNLNKILVSSKNGIDKATRKYILRMRSDLCLLNDNILSLQDDLSLRNSNHSLFKNRILGYELFSIKYDFNIQRVLFHVSDWCHFGLREDIQELFNVPLVNEPEFSLHFMTHAKDKPDIHTPRLWKMSPEQYIISQNAKKIFKNLNFETYIDFTKDNIKTSEDFIINNFRVFNQKKWGISILKSQYKGRVMDKQMPFVYYSELETRIDYQKYCGGKLSLDGLSKGELWFLNHGYKYAKEYQECLDVEYGVIIPDKKYNKKYLNAKLRMHKHIYNLLKEHNTLSNRLEQLFLSVPLSIISAYFITLKLILRGELKKNDKHC